MSYHRVSICVCWNADLVQLLSNLYLCRQIWSWWWAVILAGREVGFLPNLVRVLFAWPRRGRQFCFSRVSLYLSFTSPRNPASGGFRVILPGGFLQQRLLGTDTFRSSSLKLLSRSFREWQLLLRSLCSSRPLMSPPQQLPPSFDLDQQPQCIPVFYWIRSSINVVSQHFFPGTFTRPLRRSCLEDICISHAIADTHIWLCTIIHRRVSFWCGAPFVRCTVLCSFGTVVQSEWKR